MGPTDFQQTTDGVTNHHILQEFHRVLRDSSQLYEILRILVNYCNLGHRDGAGTKGGTDIWPS